MLAVKESREWCLWCVLLDWSSGLCLRGDTDIFDNTHNYYDTMQFNQESAPAESFPQNWDACHSQSFTHLLHLVYVCVCVCVCVCVFY